MPDPAPPTDFSALRLLTAEQLVQLGCRRWNETLVLFPASWADSIPEGFEVRIVTGRTERFSKSWPKAKLDQRLGMLAFGIDACPKEFAPTVSDRPEQLDVCDRCGASTPRPRHAGQPLWCQECKPLTVSIDDLIDAARGE